MQSKVSGNISSMIDRIHQHTDLPIAVGFGISNPDQAKAVAEMGDAIVVGSAIVNQIAEQGKSDTLVPTVSQFVGSLAQAVKEV
jgi:tryptophan synthase alpha chain